MYNKHPIIQQIKKNSKPQKKKTHVDVFSLFAVWNCCVDNNCVDTIPYRHRTKCMEMLSPIIDIKVQTKAYYNITGSTNGKTCH